MRGINYRSPTYTGNNSLYLFPETSYDPISTAKKNNNRTTKGLENISNTVGNILDKNIKIKQDILTNIPKLAKTYNEGIMDMQSEELKNLEDDVTKSLRSGLFFDFKKQAEVKKKESEFLANQQQLLAKDKQLQEAEKRYLSHPEYYDKETTEARRNALNEAIKSKKKDILLNTDVNSIYYLKGEDPVKKVEDNLNMLKQQKGHISVEIDPETGKKITNTVKYNPKFIKNGQLDETAVKSYLETLIKNDSDLAYSVGTNYLKKAYRGVVPFGVKATDVPIDKMVDELYSQSKDIFNDYQVNYKEDLSNKEENKRYDYGANGESKIAIETKYNVKQDLKDSNGNDATYTANVEKKFAEPIPVDGLDLSKALFISDTGAEYDKAQTLKLIKVFGVEKISNKDIANRFKSVRDKVKSEKMKKWKANYKLYNDLFLMYSREEPKGTSKWVKANATVDGEEVTLLYPYDEVKGVIKAKTKGWEWNQDNINNKDNNGSNKIDLEIG